MVIELTDHAILRGEERLNLTSKALRRTAQRAFETGVHHDHAKGGLKSFATEKLAMSPAGTHLRILGHQAFLFNNQYLITVLLVPKELMPRPKANRPEEDFEDEDLEDDELPCDIR